MYKKVIFVLFALAISGSVCVFADTQEEFEGPNGDAVISCGNMKVGTVSSDEEKKIDEPLQLPSLSLNEGNYSAEISVSENVQLPGISLNEGSLENENGEMLSSNDMGVGTVEETDEIVSENRAEDPEKEAIIKVSIPERVHAVLDPDNLHRKGGIYSDEYKIVNYGNRDVAIKIKKIDVLYKLQKNLYLFSENPNEDYDSNIKRMDINIVWKNEKEDTEKVMKVIDGQIDEYVLYLKASEYDEDNKYVKTNEGSAGSFYFCGNLNQDPDIQWSDGEISLSVKYEVQDAENMANQEVEKDGIKNENAFVNEDIPVEEDNINIENEID